MSFVAPSGLTAELTLMSVAADDLARAAIIQKAVQVLLHP